MPQLRGEHWDGSRTLFWRLQGQAALLNGPDKIIRLSHRPAEMFQPSTDLAESNDLAATNSERFRQMFQKLADWEANLPTVPLWGSSPFWNSQSAKHYDEWQQHDEPQ